MVKLKSVKAHGLERPAACGTGCLRCRTLASPLWKNPIGDFGGACIQSDVPEGNPADDRPVGPPGNRPAGISLGVPCRTPGFDPLVRFFCIHGAKIPFLDIWHGIGLYDGWHVCLNPRSQDEVFTGREFGLAHTYQRTLRNHRLDDSRHASSMADLIVFPRLDRRSRCMRFSTVRNGLGRHHAIPVERGLIAANPICASPGRGRSPVVRQVLPQIVDLDPTCDRVASDAFDVLLVGVVRAMRRSRPSRRRCLIDIRRRGGCST